MSAIPRAERLAKNRASLRARRYSWRVSNPNPRAPRQGAEIEELCAAVGAWLRIAHPYGGARPEDASSSALLRRLIAGGNVLPVAPPLLDDHPWYELVDQGRAEPAGVFLSNRSGRITIEKNEWEIVETVTPKRVYIVAWPPSGLRCTLTRAPFSRTRWVLELCDPADATDPGQIASRQSI